MNNSNPNSRISATGRVAALLSSVMDLHVRIALQEMDREKRRLISGLIFLTIGGSLMIFAIFAVEIISYFKLINSFSINQETSLFIIFIVNIFLAGITFRLGGLLLKGPYLPETIGGLSKTTKAVFGKSNE